MQSVNFWHHGWLSRDPPLASGVLFLGRMIPFLCIACGFFFPWAAALGEWRTTQCTALLLVSEFRGLPSLQTI
jgi:hypothetical protein